MTLVVDSTPGVFASMFFDFVRGRFGPLQRRGVGELQIQEHVSLVLVRQKARRQPGAEERREAAAGEQQRECDGALADQRAGAAHVAVRRAREDAVEPVEEPSQQAAALARVAAAAAPTARGSTSAR